MLIDLVQLRTFVSVAEEQHLTRAAERMHISQSAASAHVRAVEDTLDTQLFVRTRRNLELTPAGHLLLPEAKVLLHQATLFASFARRIRGERKGTLVVGVSSEPSASRIGKVMAALQAQHPAIHVDLRARHSSGTRQALKTGEIDIGFLLAHPAGNEFSHYKLASLRFRVAGPAAWKDRIAQADWEELASLPWITPSSSSLAYSAMLAELFTQRGLELNTVAHFDNIVLARTLLKDGVGMMLMREDHALQEEREGHVAISPLAQAEFPLYMEHLTGRKDDPLISAFVDAVSCAWPDMALAGTPVPS